MRLQVSSRLGHFNLADPSQESFSCSIRAMSDDGNIIKGCSILPEYPIELSDLDPENIGNDMATAIEEYQKHLWLSTSREKDLEFAKWLREHNDELVSGNKLARIDELKKQKEHIESELKSLEAL